jgi:RNA polymerase sigma-70 factor (ECF subfamily)
MRREYDVVTHDVDVVSLARPSALDSPQTALEQRDRVALLRAALDKLAPSLRTAVMLRDIQELSYQEIADKLHVPEGTVKSRINRGRAELARQIARLRQQQETAPTKGARRAPARSKTGAAR